MPDLVDALHPLDTKGNAAAMAREIGERAAPFVAQHDRDGTFVEEGYEAVRDTGFGNLAVPRELGGGGHGLDSICRAHALLARSCANTALAISMHSHTILGLAWRWRLGDDAVEPILRRIVEEGLILCQSGTLNPERINVTATPCDGGYLVSGRKAFCSGAPGSDIMVCAVRVAGEEGPPVSVFVPLGGDGIEIVANWDAMGMRGSGSNSVALTDAFVPEENVLYRAGRPMAGATEMDRDGKEQDPDGEEAGEPRGADASGAPGEDSGGGPASNGTGASGTPPDPEDGVRAGMRMPGLHIALPVIAAVYLGAAGGVRDRAMRIVAGSGRANTPATVRLAGLMAQDIRTGWWVLESLMAETTDQSIGTQPHAITSLLAKRQVVLSSIAVVETAMELVGSASYLRDRPLEQAMRDVRAAITHPLAPEATLHFVGRALLNRTASQLQAGGVRQ